MRVGSNITTSSVCKACTQKVEKLLKFESSVSSILSTLKASSIQALALTATTQVLWCSASEESISPLSHPLSERPALEDNRLTPSTVSAKTTSSNKTLFE